MELDIINLPAVIWRYLLTIQLTDVLDIAIMAFVLYKLLKLVQSTKSASLLKGLCVFMIALFLSYVLQLHSIYYLMSRMVDMGILALIILFQPEIRRILEQMGSRRIIGSRLSCSRVTSAWRAPTNLSNGNRGSLTTT